MLRTVVAALLLANLVFWTYTQGGFSALGWAPHSGREPERLAQQVAADKLRVRNATPAMATAPATQPPTTDTPAPAPATEASATDRTESAERAPGDGAGDTSAPVVAATGPTACWQAPGLNPNQTVLIRAALENQPNLAPRWSLDESVLPARWIVYLGKFPSADALQRRRAELREAKVDHREVNTPSLQPGLALGTYSTEEAARRALNDVTRQGIASARVVQERQETRQYTLRLPALDDTQRRRIAALGVLGDRPLQRCP